MAVINVSNSIQLNAALQVVQGGDRIVLAAGSYGDLSVSSRSFTSTVTITSADAGHPAVFNTIGVRGSSNIQFDGIDVKFTPTAATNSWSEAVMIDNSRGITFANGKMVGGPAVNGVAQTATVTDSTDNITGLPAGRAFTIQNSSDVKVQGMDISVFDRGIQLVSANRVTISNNDIHDLRRSGIVGNSENLVIDGNHLHDSHPWKFGAPEGDHADFIALWTDSRQTAPTQNISITNNVMEQGKGSPILGMWMQGGSVGYSNATIQGNVILGGHGNGISLWDVHGGVVKDNVLVQVAAGQAAPFIWLTATATGLDVSGNYASDITDLGLGLTGNKVHDNQTLQTSAATADGYLSLAKAATLAGSAAQIRTVVSTDILHVEAVKEAPVASADVFVTAASSTPGGIVHLGSWAAETVAGTGGADSIVSNGGADSLMGGAGNDLYYVSDGAAKIVELADGGIDTLVAKGDRVLDANVENLIINNTQLDNWAGIGNELNNVIIGNGGNNPIDGMAGNDTLDGGAGNDNIRGGAGNDLLLGGRGSDTLTGGAGADTFVISSGYGADVVTDFTYADGDRVRIVGAATYTASQVGADTVVKLSTGEQLTLNGVKLASLPNDWIFSSTDIKGGDGDPGGAFADPPAIAPAAATPVSAVSGDATAPSYVASTGLAHLDSALAGPEFQRLLMVIDLGLSWLAP